MLLPLSPAGQARQREDCVWMNQVTAVIDVISIDTDGTWDSEVDADFIVFICRNLVVVDESSYLSVCPLVGSRVPPDQSRPTV